MVHLEGGNGFGRSDGDRLHLDLPQIHAEHRPRRSARLRGQSRRAPDHEQSANATTSTLPIKLRPIGLLNSTLTRPSTLKSYPRSVQTTEKSGLTIPLFTEMRIDQLLV